jgi:hypothetical protein
MFDKILHANEGSWPVFHALTLTLAGSTSKWP